MYEEYFALREAPFSIAPDPRYLYMSEGHQEALAHLLYGISNDGGFVLLTGEVGTGKTTVCRRFLQQSPEDTNVAFILNPRMTVEELLANVCDELGIRYPAGNSSVKVFVDLINEYLLEAHARGQRTVVIVEEAQNLGFDVLEQLRLLTNLETDRRKLLQIIMLGQPELRDMLARPELRQLAQRITARYHLGPIKKDDLPLYISYRLDVAGVKGRLFPYSVMGKLYRISGGIPRLINVLCDRALLGAYVKGLECVDGDTLDAAAREVLGDYPSRKVSHSVFFWSAGILLAIGLFVSAFLYSRSSAIRPERSLEVKPIVSVAGQLPDHAPPAGGADEAYNVLFKQWGAYYKPEGLNKACAQAASQGLRCMKRHDGLWGLARLNVPAVLKLFDSTGREYFAVLLSLKGSSATISVGSQMLQTGIDVMTMRWPGEYTILWRPPAGFKSVLRRNDKGELVVWLKKRMAVIQGHSDTEVGSIFDEALVSRVKEFQRVERLFPDGDVGPETIIHINTRYADGPRLLSLEKGRN